MLRFFKDASVRSKLNIILGGVGLAFVLLILFVQFTLNENQKLANELEFIQQQYIAMKTLDRDFLELRRAEKDFRMRLDLKYLEKHDQVNKNVMNILESSTFEDEEMKEILGELKKHASDYKTQFDSFSKLIVEMGLTEKEGLRGRLRGAVHAIEERVSEPRALVQMLMLRRHEKDFIIRHDDKYIQRFFDRIPQLGAFLSSQEDKDDLQNYSDAFRAYSDAYKQSDAFRASFTQAAHEIAPHVAELFDRFAILSSEKSQIVHANQAALKRNVFIIGVIAVLFSGLLVFFVGTSIRSGIQECVAFSKKLGSGDLRESLSLDRGDELGQLADALSEMGERLGKLVEQVRSDAQQVQVYAETMRGTSEETNQNMGVLSDKVAQILEVTERLNQVVNEVSANTTETSDRVQTIASATEEMTITVNEIAQNADNARDVSQDAVSMADESRTKNVELKEQASAIQEVINSIVEIAEQTKLLALNATIEAARAGEAGKGFAVVASEVKELALQSNEASEAIKGRTDAIQRATDSSLEKMSHVHSRITNANDMVVTIATAVEEQAVTNREISDAIEGTKNATHVISQTLESTAQDFTTVVNAVTEVTDIGNQAKEASDQLHSSSLELETMSKQMMASIASFQV